MGGPPPRKREDLKPAAVAPPWGQVEASRHPAFEFSSQLCSGASSCPQFQAGGGVGNPHLPALEFSTQVDLGFSTPSPANLSLMINLSAHDHLPCMTRLSPEPSVCFRGQLWPGHFRQGYRFIGALNASCWKCRFYGHPMKRMPSIPLDNWRTGILSQVLRARQPRFNAPAIYDSSRSRATLPLC